MRRFATPLVAAVCLLATAPAALAQYIEIGATADRPPASCPADPCQAITRTSGFQVTTRGRRFTNLMVAPKNGRVVSFTLRLGNPSREQIEFFNANYGGRPQVRLTILRPPSRGTVYRLVGQSEMFELTGLLGRSVEFPLLRSLFVQKGYVVAITTPTWVPAIALGLDEGNAWRSSRAQNDCERQPPPMSAQMSLGSLRGYRCLYRTARLTYSAKMVVNPTPRN